MEQKLSSQQGCYNITEAQAIMTELKNIQKSLTSGEKERADLMQSLAKLKDDRSDETAVGRGLPRPFNPQPPPGEAQHRLSDRSVR